jgi:membrane associated rhomboid family serine protease
VALAATLARGGSAGRGAPVRIADAGMSGSEQTRAPPRRGWTALALVTTMVVLHALVVARCADARGGATVWLESAWSMGSCRAELEAAGALAMGRVWIDGELWRVLTAPWLHGSWLHLGLNGWSLVEVWPWIAAAWGTGRALVCFALGAVAGCLASLAWAEAPLVVGASGGILALAAGVLLARVAGRPAQRRAVAEVSPRALAATLGGLVALGFVVPIIAQAGHLGGLLMGSTLALAFGRRPLLGWAAAAALVGGLGLAARVPSWTWRYHEAVGLRRLELGDHVEASAALEEALRRRPGDPSLSNAVAYGWANAGVQLERARELVDLALAAEPDNPDYRDTLGWILCRQGDPDRGLDELRAAQRGSAVPVPEIEDHLERCRDVAVR